MFYSLRQIILIPVNPVFFRFLDFLLININNDKEECYKEKEEHCKSDCFKHGRCNDYSNQCICEDEYEGTFCQLKKDKNKIKILSKKIL